MDNETKKENNNSDNNTSLDRRELLKGLATLPVLGAFFASLWAKYRRDAMKKSALLQDLIKEKKAPSVVSSIGNHERLRIGIIGYGGRGSHLVRGAGFATPGWTKRASENAKNNKLDKGFATFMQQEDLNTSLTVCVTYSKFELIKGLKHRKMKLDQVVNRRKQQKNIVTIKRC